MPHFFDVHNFHLTKKFSKQFREHRIHVCFHHVVIPQGMRNRFSNGEIYRPWLVSRTAPSLNSRTINNKRASQTASKSISYLITYSNSEAGMGVALLLFLLRTHDLPRPQQRLTIYHPTRLEDHRIGHQCCCPRFTLLLASARRKSSRRALQFCE